MPKITIWKRIKRAVGLTKYSKQGGGKPGNFAHHEMIDPYTGPRGSARPHLRTTVISPSRWRVGQDPNDYGEIWRRVVIDDDQTQRYEGYYAKVYRSKAPYTVAQPYGEYFENLADANAWCNIQLDRDESEPR